MYILLSLFTNAFVCLLQGVRIVFQPAACT